MLARGVRGPECGEVGASSFSTPRRAGNGRGEWRAWVSWREATRRLEEHHAQVHAARTQAHTERAEQVTELLKKRLVDLDRQISDKAKADKAKADKAKAERVPFKIAQGP